jgi:hypothetical protein
MTCLDPARWTSTAPLGMLRPGKLGYTFASVGKMSVASAVRPRFAPFARVPPMVSLDFRRDIAPFLVATIGEFVALTTWLILLEQHRSTEAALVLWSGFAVERIAVASWVRSAYSPGQGNASSPLWAIAAFIIVITIAEVAIWSVWLNGTTNWGIGPAGGLLLVLIHALHSLEMGSVKRQNPLVYAVNGHTIVFSIMEAVGATAWIWLWRDHHPLRGAVALLIGLTVEHIVQGASLKPQPAPGLGQATS